MMDFGTGSAQEIREAISRKVTESSNIKVFSPTSKEYQKLQLAASLMNAFYGDDNTFTVGETYFDYGQDWKWTTIFANHGTNKSFQALNPRDHGLIVNASNAEELGKVADSVLAQVRHFL